MKDYLFNFYNESKVKRARRKKILNDTLPYILKVGTDQLTVTEIAEFLKMERRTLYDYYPTKDDLIVDLAFISVNEINEKYMELAETLNIANIEQSSKERLKIILKGIAQIINNKYAEQFNFITGFDVYYHHLERSSNAFLRYSYVITGFKTKHHYLEAILKDMKKDYNIAMDINNMIEVVEQSFHAYLARILIKQDESNRYNMENIDIYIELIANGLCN